MIAEKRAAYENRGKNSNEGDLAVGAERNRADEAAPDSSEEASFPPSASMCYKCNTKALVLMDGCQTCLSCGYSKCG